MNNVDKKTIRKISKQPKTIKSFFFGRISLDIYDNNAIMFKLYNKNINWFYACAQTKTSTIDTSTAQITDMKSDIKDDICHIEISYKQNDLILKQYFEIEKNKNYFTTYIKISGNRVIESNRLIPLNFIYPHPKANELFLSLEEKMISVPYDNDMWVHYDSLPLRPGRSSYDVTAIYDDSNNNGLIIGALDFDTWKNAIVCSSYDARSFYAISGIADAQTHDHLPHGYIKAKEISSSRFIVGFYKDIRKGFEEYGKLCINKDGIYHWNHGVPFGWNSYSALTLKTTLKDVETAADFLSDVKDFKTEDGITYINFDAVINIDRNKLKKLIRKLHSKNQKVGWYMNPLSHLSIDDDTPLLGSDKYRKDILLKNDDGSLYPPIDNKYPIDITIPEAELDFRLKLREFVELDFDYIKIDFLSHGALEGKYHNPEIKTGRQALNYFYNIVKQELDPEKINKEVFISSSIDPLFPCGYSHARRSCCDSFGHIEDVKYVLNSLTYGYWTNNTLYQFNDPDHTVLFNSLVDGRSDTSLNEARSRYNASVISGTVMLLSDDYSKKQAIDRTKKLANNRQLNRLARLNKAFKPITLSKTSNIYYLNDKDNYVAVFNFEDHKQSFNINPKDIGFKNKGTLLNLNNNRQIEYDKHIDIELDKYDSVVLKAK